MIITVHDASGPGEGTGTEEGVLRVLGASAGIGPGTTNIGADASAPGVGVAADTERIGAHAVS
jgi:hypothetical protein